ncbi:hypothetical protein GCM10009792_25490 [Microcella alkalica]|uniref:Uncharacterized protein n=1 Tax=Microcella alkalica TaxID=355930 RepID=A0A839E858_9MICO|nr:hypothetical protein [Microcella alkalica]MBA8847687.1 hypothetical protein [Microcella alkalica]
MIDDDARDRARALYGRLDPNRLLPDPPPDAHPAAPAPAASTAPPPATAAELPPPDEPDARPAIGAQPLIDVEPEPGRGPRRPLSRGGRVAVAAGFLVIGAALTAVAIVTEPQPSLAVFDREPTEVEVEKLGELTRLDYFGLDADVAPRLLLEAPSRTRGEADAQRVWALRIDGARLGTPDGADYVCLLLESFSSGPGDYGGCMLEPDAARRGFVPLDQPRPSLVVEGELRVIQWGPTGDARLIDPPTLPGDDPSDEPGDGPEEAHG